MTRNNNCLKIGGRVLKVFLVALLCSIITGLLLVQVEANDTRNRVLAASANADASIRIELKYSPFDGSTRTEGTSVSESLGTINYIIYKDRIESINKIKLNKYLPAQAIYKHIPPEYGFEGMLQMDICNRSDVDIGGETYFREASLKATGLAPNSKYYADSGTNVLYAGVVKEIKHISSSELYGKYRNVGFNIDEGYGYLNSNRIVTSPVILKYNLEFWTPADDPTIIVTNITTDTATISWDTNNTNPRSTSYTLQYQILPDGGDPSNESHWGNIWTTIPIGGATTTTVTTTTQNIFSQGNIYRLRVQVNHKAGSSYNVYSDYVIFSTSTDPAVRAAHEAAIAAQAAKKAAEDSSSYSLDAKSSIDDLKREVTKLQSDVTEILQKLNSLSTSMPQVDTNAIANAVVDKQIIKDISTYSLEARDFARKKAIKVIDGVNFKEVVYGKIPVPSGKTSDTKDGVTATPNVNDYTILTGSLSGEGIKAVIFGSGVNTRGIIFNVIAPPRFEDIATINFE